MQSLNQDSVGTVSKKYSNFDMNKEEKIGSGGFGDVYRCYGTNAVKEEHKVSCSVCKYLNN